MTQDAFFECRLELFEAITRTFCKSIKRFFVPKCGPRFVPIQQILDNLYRLLRRAAKRNSLHAEDDLEALRDFDCSSVDFSDVLSFHEKTDFRAKSMGLAKSKFGAGREKKKVVETFRCHCSICH